MVNRKMEQSIIIITMNVPTTAIGVQSNTP